MLDLAHMLLSEDASATDRILTLLKMATSEPILKFFLGKHTKRQIAVYLACVVTFDASAINLCKELRMTS